MPGANDSGRWALLTANKAKKCGFTGSVGTQNTNYIASMDIAIQTGEDLLLTELLANVSTV